MCVVDADGDGDCDGADATVSNNEALESILAVKSYPETPLLTPRLVH